MQRILEKIKMDTAPDLDAIENKFLKIVGKTIRGLFNRNIQLNSEIRGKDLTSSYTKNASVTILTTTAPSAVHQVSAKSSR